MASIIATYTSILNKTGVGKTSNQVPVKNAILELGGGLVVSGSYASNLLVRLDDINKIAYNYILTLSPTTKYISAAGGSTTIPSPTSLRLTLTNGIVTNTESWGYSTSSRASGSLSLSGSTVSAGNNTSTSRRYYYGRYTQNNSGKTVDFDIVLYGGSKEYGTPSYSISLTVSPSTVSASGGSSSVSSSVTKYTPYTWNGVSGSGGTESSNMGAATISKSGSGSYSNGTVTFSNNTSTSSRTATITASYSGATSVSKTITLSAGAKQYSSWSNYIISLSASPNPVQASGGSSTISASASRTRTWTWNGVSGSGGTETETATPSLSSSGSGAFNGTTVTFSNNTSTSTKTRTITATYGGVSKSITVTQSAGVYSSSYELITNYGSSTSTSATSTLTSNSLLTITVGNYYTSEAQTITWYFRQRSETTDIWNGRDSAVSITYGSFANVYSKGTGVSNCTVSQVSGEANYLYKVTTTLSENTSSSSRTCYVLINNINLIRLQFGLQGNISKYTIHVVIGGNAINSGRLGINNTSLSYGNGDSWSSDTTTGMSVTLTYSNGSYCNSTSNFCKVYFTDKGSSTKKQLSYASNSSPGGFYLSQGSTEATFGCYGNVSTGTAGYSVRIYSGSISVNFTIACI